MKYVTPSIDETAFSCPHCGAYTTQTWFKLFVERLVSEEKRPATPNIPTPERIEALSKNAQVPDEIKKKMLDFATRMNLGEPFNEKLSSSVHLYFTLNNAWTSACYNCNRISVWVHERLVFPSIKSGAAPNPDLPDDIRKDVEEARSIVDNSPRGAAALLRLAIQKLCRHLGEPGKDINQDIKSLVAKGLNPMVQQSLDVVRVVGNEAVHPGTIDLHDDRSIAERLFDLINIIASQMITHPKMVEEMYAKLPPEKLAGIQKRDAPKE